MATTADAYLIYGISLGGDEPGWNIAGLDEGDTWRPTWGEYSDLDGDGTRTWLDPIGEMETRLAAELGHILGYRHPGEDAPASKVLEELGLEVLQTGNIAGYTRYYVAGSVTRAGVAGLPLSFLPSVGVSNALLLERVPQALDIQITAPPRWHLVANYG